MKTFLSNRYHPYVRLEIDGVDDSVELDCLIDTGFAGGLAMPVELKDEFDFPLIGRQIWELADGSQIELEVFLGELELGVNAADVGVGREKNKTEIAIIFTGTQEGLVGIEFLRNKKFVLDLKKNQIELR